MTLLILGRRRSTAAKLDTDLDFGLVDNKSAAAGERWQGLRFVYRRGNR